MSCTRAIEAGAVYPRRFPVFISKLGTPRAADSRNVNLVSRATRVRVAAFSGGLRKCCGLLFSDVRVTLGASSWMLPYAAL